MSWESLQDEVRRLRALGDHSQSLENTIRELEIYQEEVERQNRELIEAQGVLERSRERYAALFDAAPVGYLTLDALGVIEEANLLASQIFGVRRDRLVGTPLVAMLGWDQLLAHLEAVRRCEEAVHTRMHVENRDAGRRTVEICSRLAEDGDSIRMILTDLTELERAEAERRELEVRARVAREASEAKDRFIAMLSHELRTPLTPVLASLEILAAETGLSEQALIEIARIRRSVSAEVRIIDDLLDLVRIRRGAVQLRRGWVELPALVAECLESLGTAGHAVRTSVPAEPKAIFADSVRLRQILTNLLRNALTATRDGGEVSLRAEWTDAALELIVEDTGVGILPNRLERLFAAFERDESPGSGTGRLGLGLVISQALARAHGGSIRADSDGHGKGSRFTLTIPAVEARALGAAPAPRAGSEPRPSRAEALESGTARRILLVDDHADTVHSLRKLLERRGYHVEVASSLAQALEAAEERFDAIVSDVALGDGTGHELLERLRERRCHTPAIAVSGFGTPDDLARSREAGFCEHLVKPLKIDRLIDALEAALD